MKASFVLVSVLIVLGLALAFPSAPGAKCTSNRQCRLQVCKLGRCGAQSDRDDICDEDADCYGERVCFKNRCTFCPGQTDCSPSGSDEFDCKDLSTDFENCGTCGNVCDDGQACTKGVCSAPTCDSYTAEELLNCYRGGPCPEGLSRPDARSLAFECYPPRSCAETRDNSPTFQDCCFDGNCPSSLSQIVACNSAFTCLIVGK